MSTYRLGSGLCLSLLAVGGFLLPGHSLAARTQSDVEVTCNACLVVDEAGDALFARNASTPLPNASTTKIMTALVVVDEADLHEETVVSANAAAVPDGRLGLAAGERWSVEELLFALLLSSSNDAAVSLAEHVAGDEGSFVAKMNARARELGLEDTTFVTSHGLDASGHAASARDLAVLGAEALQEKAIAEIVATKLKAIQSSDREVTVDNTNLLLESYRGADGVKTGFTAMAGNVLVGSAERDGRRLIAVAMDSVDAFEDVTALLDHGFSRLERTILLDATTLGGEIILEGAGATTVFAGGHVRGSALRESTTRRFEISRSVSLPLESGDVVGRIVVVDETGRVIGVVAARSTDSLAAPDADWRRDLLMNILAFAGGWIEG